MDPRDTLLGLVKLKGPVLPAQINKEVKTNVLFASAMLAELVSARKLKVTSLKVGGSPLYYTLGQEPKLEPYLKYLDEKEQFACSRLKAQRILLDDEQEPLVRVALRNSKDFAKPLEVRANGKTLLFWKWYLLLPIEAEVLIKEKINPAPPPQPPTPPSTPPMQTPTRPQQRVKVPQPIPPEQKSIEVTAPPSLTEEDLVSDDVRKEIEDSTRQIFERMQRKPKRPKKKTTRKTGITPKPVVKKPEPKQTIIKEKKKEPVKEDPLEEQEETTFEDTFIDTAEPNDPFFKKIKKYFNKNNIEIVKYDVLRKNSDIEFEILLPSSVGELRYFCKAKNKKKCNDGDVGAAYLQAQSRKLPVLFLTTGEIAKKALVLLKKECKNMTVKQI